MVLSEGDPAKVTKQDSLPNIVKHSNSNESQDIMKQGASGEPPLSPAEITAALQHPVIDPTAHDITLDPPTTEDEEDTVDALLSLGTDMENTDNTISMEMEDNALVMPIGSVGVTQDVNPVPT